MKDNNTLLALIEKGTLNAKDTFFTATMYGDLERIKFFIEKKLADINALTDISKLNALHEAVIWEHPEVCKYLLENNININMKGSCGETPLHWAYKKNNEKIKTLLLVNDADKTIKSDGGWAPEQWSPDYEYPVDLTGLLGPGYSAH